MSFLSRAGIKVLLGFKALSAPVAFGACAIAEDRKGRVLLVRHSYQPGWHLPGGGVAAGEPPANAILRELKEEIGLVRSEPPELIGIFTRKMGWTTNVIALFHVRGGEIAFTPNLEIREVIRADPRALPDGTTRGACRRLAEFVGTNPQSPYW